MQSEGEWSYSRYANAPCKDVTDKHALANATFDLTREARVV